MKRCPCCGVTGAKLEAKLNKAVKLMGLTSKPKRVAMPNIESSWNFLESLRSLRKHGTCEVKVRGRKPFYAYHKGANTVYYVTV